MSDPSPVPDSTAIHSENRIGARRALDVAAIDSGEFVSAAEAELFESLGPLLDPRDENDSGRIARQLRSSRVPGPSLDAFLARVASEALEPETRQLAALVCGQNAMFAGDLVEADRRVRGVLLASRGSGTRIERIAVLALGRVSLQSRREFEALVLARRTVREMDAACDTWGSVMSRLTVCAVYSLIGDMPRLTCALDDVEPRIGEVTDPVRYPLAARTYHSRRAEVLRSRGRYDAALGALRAYEYVGGRLYPGERRAAQVLEADILFALGLFDRCAECLAVAAASGPTTDAAGLRVRARRLQLDVCLRGATVADDAEVLLDDLRSDAGAGVGPAARRELALLIAETLGSEPVALPVVRRAYDVAAAASFERLAEVDRFVREVPESATPTDDDLVVLNEFRRRTLVAQREIHQAVARLLASAARAGQTPAPMIFAAGELTCVCAWCQRVRTTDGVWLSVQQFLPLQLEGAIELTHGICEACVPRLRLQIREEVGAAAP